VSFYLVEPGRIKSNSFMKGMRQIERFIEEISKLSSLNKTVIEQGYSIF